MGSMNTSNVPESLFYFYNPLFHFWTYVFHFLQKLLKFDFIHNWNEKLNLMNAQLMSNFIYMYQSPRKLSSQPEANLKNMPQ